MIVNQYIAKALAVSNELDLQGIRVPLLIMSHPGYGKTSTVKMWCEYCNYNFISLIASAYASDDILGLQTLRDEKMVRLTPSWYNKMIELMKNGKRTVLFLDELTTANEFLQAPLLDLIFSKSLGEHKLPENVFIVAAGNYSEDLNNSFKMFSSLVNRFVILNLRKSDFAVEDFIDDPFESISSDQLEDYLSLKREKSLYKFELFKDWVQSKNEVSFGKSHYSEDEERGLTGYTSIRSLSYCLKFAKQYFEMFPDDLWIRIVGDTLGVSEKRAGKFMEVVIDSAKAQFLSSRRKDNDINVLCDSLLSQNSSRRSPQLDLLLQILEKTPPELLTIEESSKIKKVFVKFAIN